jgi:hypothetical protein
MPLTDLSGEEIKKGDRVVYCGVPGEVEFVADPLANPDYWFVKEFGGGAMILDSQIGSVFLHEPGTDDELLFVSRRE